MINIGENIIKNNNFNYLLKEHSLLCLFNNMN